MAYSTIASASASAAYFTAWPLKKEPRNPVLVAPADSDSPALAWQSTCTQNANHHNNSSFWVSEANNHYHIFGFQLPLVVAARA